MRIAFAYSGYSHRITSGIIVQVDAMMAFLRARGHDVFFYPVKEVHWFPSVLQLVLRILRPSLGVAFSEWLHHVRPDVVVTQGLHVPESRTIAFMQNRPWKFLLIQHGFPNRPLLRLFADCYMWAIGNKILAAANHTVVVSHFTKEKVRAHGGQHITIVPLGIDLHTFRPLSDAEKRRARHRFRVRKSLILGVGRFIFLKNFDTLIRAMRDVPDAQCFLVGGGFHEQTLRLLARTLGIERRIRFFPFITRADLVRLYNIADVFVLPSLAEGLGLVLIESLACGTPVIGSRLEGIQDIIEQGKNGFYLNDPKDPTELATTIRELLEHPELRKKMGEYGIKSVHRKFNRERLLLQLEKVIIKLCR